VSFEATVETVAVIMGFDSPLIEGLPAVYGRGQEGVPLIGAPEGRNPVEG